MAQPISSQVTRRAFVGASGAVLAAAAAAKAAGIGTAHA